MMDISDGACESAPASTERILQTVAHPDIDTLNNTERFSAYVTFKAIPGALGTDRAETIAQATDFFAQLEQEGKVTVRGLYNVTGIRPEADFMIWWHAERFEDLQDALSRFRRDTVLGQVVDLGWIGNGVHRPSEFNKRHLPAFIMGEEPGDWITVYPFIRSYDWYLMDAEDRSRILREHGMAAADFADVRANTIPAFALGDYEWMLSFEAPELGRIVDLMHKMRYTEARLHVRDELPFYSGRRVNTVEELVSTLP
nr:hydrogen peroxide-dependent heme synthase [Corynebacterium doosanense]